MIFHNVLRVFHDLLHVLQRFMMFSESRNDWRPRGSRSPQGSHNAAVIGNNSAEIGDNSEEMGDDASGIVDTAAKVIHAKLCPESILEFSCH